MEYGPLPVEGLMVTRRFSSYPQALDTDFRREEYGRKCPPVSSDVRTEFTWGGWASHRQLIQLKME